MKDSTVIIEKKLKKEEFDKLPLGRNNFIAMAVAGAMIVIGFLLMLGGGSSIEEGFNQDIFSTRRIVVGPAIAFLGFVAMAVAVCIIPRESKNDNNNGHP